MNSSTNSKGGIMNTISGLFGGKKNNTTANGSTPAVNSTAVLSGGKRRKSRRGRKSRKGRKGRKTRTHRKH